MRKDGDRVIGDLTVRYIAVLAVLSVLAILSFIAVTSIITDAERSSETVNVAGRQRVLIERAAHEADHLASLGRANSEASEQLSATLDALETSNAQILGDGRHPGSDIEEDLFLGDTGPVDREMRDFIEHGRRLLRPFNVVSSNDPDLKAMLTAASGALLDRLDEVALKFQRNNEIRMKELLRRQAMALGATLLALGVSAFGVFRPLVERLSADIADRRRVVEELRESEERLWRILEESPVGVSVSRRSDGRIIFANSRFTDILRMNKTEFVGSYARDYYVDDAQRRTVLATLRRDGQIEDAEVEFRRRNGMPVWTLLTIRATNLKHEAVNLAWIYDITEHKAAEQQILLAAKVLETVSEAVLITDATNEIIFVNPAFTAISGYSRDEVLGRDPGFLSSGRHHKDFYATLWAELKSTGHWSGEIWNRRKSGEFYAEWLSISTICDQANQISHYVAVFSDITSRKEDEERVWRQANYDALTGLPNRLMFLDRLEQAVRQARRESVRFALLFLDLDGFKVINDSLGHDAGDLLLQQAAKRLGGCMRKSDTLARLAGDEFVVILQSIRGRDEVAIVAGKILEVLARPYKLKGAIGHVQGSIGISVFPDDAGDGPELIKVADEAMYRVKRQGKNAYCFANDR